MITAPNNIEREHSLIFFKGYLAVFPEKGAFIITEMSYILVRYYMKEIDRFGVKQIFSFFADQFPSNIVDVEFQTQLLLNHIFLIILSQHFIYFYQTITSIFEYFVQLSRYNVKALFLAVI